MDNVREVWEVVLTELKNILAQTVISTWIDSLKPVSLTANTLVLAASNEFKRNIVESRFSLPIKEAFEKSVGFKTELEIIVKSDDDAINFDFGAENTGMDPVVTKKSTFQNFVVGPTNSFAYTASRAVAENPGTLHNPLFIYSESGLGKTHLLKAIQAELQRKNPSLNIILTSGENFLNEMLDHMYVKNMAEFHNKYRNADVLLVDDVQFIATKPMAQEEFFYTFEALTGQHKQMVMTCDRPPRDMKTLEDRLISRFMQGLLADIQAPMLETRIAIIKQCSEKFYNMNLSNDVVEYIAERLKNNVRQIEGVVQKIHAIHTLSGEQITIGVANDAIKDVVYYAQPTEVTINNIIDEVAKTFGVSADDIRGERKKAEISNARQVAMYVIRETTNLTYEEIGNSFGGKKHSTVIYSIESIESKMEDNADLKNNIFDIMKKIKSEIEG